jgi:hypothetical protein
VPASRAGQKALRNLAGDTTKKKETVKRMVLPPVAPEPDVLDAPPVNDIAAANVFDNMPNRYETNFVNFVEGIWVDRYEYVEFCNVGMMETEFLPILSSF